MNGDQSFILVSDFHLAGGKNSHTMMVDRREEFFADTTFAHFLEALYQRARAEDRPCRLVLLGDIFDFLRVNLTGEKISRLNTSILAAQQKLERIAEGHPEFFQALRRFLEHGFMIDILPGNHDIELVRPETQETLKNLLAGSTPLLRNQIFFHPWIMYVPGLFYAEHGQQYHSINAFQTPLAPFPEGNAHRLQLPLGSHLETYLFDLIQAVFPEEEMQPGLQVLTKAVREKPAKLLAALPLHIRFAAQMMRSMITSASPFPGIWSKEYETGILPAFSAESGLSTQILASLHRLSSTNPIGRIPHIFRDARAPLSEHYLYQASLKIHSLLTSQAMQVPFYVFGHTHYPVKAQIRPSATEAYYLNCGSWAGKPANSNPFVEIRHGTEHSPKAASLLSWDDRTGRIEPYVESSG